MKHRTPPTLAIAVCTLALQQSAGAIQLFPAGTFDAPRGALAGAGPWTLDSDAAAALIQRTRNRTNPLVVDYEHQTLLAPQNGQPAPAAGWIDPTTLEWRTDGLWGAASWTERAAAMIEAGEYRFLSPVFRYDAAGHPLELLSVALTNNPAIDGMAAVAAATANLSNPTPEPTVDISELIERLCYLLNLPLTSTPEEIAAQLDKLKTMVTATPTAAASGLFGLLTAQDAEIAALRSAAPDPAHYVPVATLQAMQTELAALRADNLSRQVNDLVEPALSDGRLLPAMEAWARDLGKTNLAALATYLQTAQPIAALSGTQTGGKTPGGTGAASGHTLEARCQSAWEGSAALREEFGGRFGAYLALCRNEPDQAPH